MSAGLYATTLDTVAELSHIVTLNEVANALSAACLFGVKARQSNGLKLTLYGGNFSTDSGPVQLTDTVLALTPSTTNYIYADTAGAVSLVTVAPSGWPGPLASGALALYQLTVGTDSITSGTNYLVGRQAKGSTGAQGATGEQGSPLYRQRRRTHVWPGYSALMDGEVGFDATTLIGAQVSIAEASTSFFTAIPQHNQSTGDTSANTSGGFRCTNNLFFLGNNAGWGGFDILFRFACNNTSAHIRQFIGLKDHSGGNPTNTVNPSAYVNIIGVGIDDGDSNLYLMHNDGSGSATKTLLNSDDSPTVQFPARGGASPEAWYELRLIAEANSSSVDYSLTALQTGAQATGNISTDLPANTQFLGWIFYINNGGTGGTQASMRVAGVSANSRY